MSASFSKLRPDFSTPARAAKTLERVAKLVRERELFAAQVRFDGGSVGTGGSTFGFSDARPPSMKIELYGRMDVPAPKKRKPK